MALHTRKVFGLAYRFTGRVDEAEDLTQEVFVKVYQMLNRYRESDGAFAGWLATVARNHAIDHYRRRKQERLRRDEDVAGAGADGGERGAPAREPRTARNARGSCTAGCARCRRSCGCR